jgi:PAS domain S-box-containing protein
MNIAYELFLLFFNLTQLHNKELIIQLFTEGMSEAFKPAQFDFYNETESNNELVLEIKTQKSHFGFIQIKQAEELTSDNKTLIRNSVQMLAVVLERLAFDEKLQEEKRTIEKIAEKRYEELQKTIAELNEARNASLNLIEDLTEENEKRKKYEKELKESEERFRLVMENSLDAILITSPDGSILNANKAACSMFQMTEDEICSTGRNGLVNLEDPNLRKFTEERQKKGYVSGELTFFRKSGSLFPADITSSLYKTRKGELRTSLIIRDITERKQAEEKLRNSDRIFEHSVDMMSVSGFDGYFKTLNPSWERTLGWSTEELLSKPWNDFVHPDDLEATNNIKAEIVDGRTAYRFENRYRCKDGTYRWLSWNAFPYTEENVMFAVARDITKSKQDEAILRESEERFSIAFQASPAPLVISEIETGLFIDVNDRWIKMLGYSREEQIGKTSKDVGIWHNPSERDRVVQQVFKNGFFKDEYIEFNTKGGEVILALWSAETIMHSGRKLMLSMIHDITARIKAERELRILKENLEVEVEEKTQELRQRITELERFQEATIEREFRIKELRDEIKLLKSKTINTDHETS